MNYICLDRKVFLPKPAIHLCFEHHLMTTTIPPWLDTLQEWQCEHEVLVFGVTDTHSLLQPHTTGPAATHYS